MAASLVLTLPGTGKAQPGDGVTIGDVADMKPRKAIKYIHNEASRRVLEIGKMQGDTVLRCLSPEFVGIEKGTDGNHVFPRGLKAAIRLVHRANNNGNEAEPAAEAIGGMVDLVAERVCGVTSRTGSSR